jgi:hypothetical protein
MLLCHKETATSTRAIECRVQFSMTSLVSDEERLRPQRNCVDVSAGHADGNLRNSLQLHGTDNIRLHHCQITSRRSGWTVGHLFGSAAKLTMLSVRMTKVAVGIMLKLSAERGFLPGATKTPRQTTDRGISAHDGCQISDPNGWAVVDADSVKSTTWRSHHGGRDAIDQVHILNVSDLSFTPKCDVVVRATNTQTTLSDHQEIVTFRWVLVVFCCIKTQYHSNKLDLQRQRISTQGKTRKSYGNL